MKEWQPIRESLDNTGFAKIKGFLSSRECDELIKAYPDNRLYRNTIDMKRYRFGEGQYKYFNYPLPALIQKIREEFYPELAILANQWNEKLGIKERYPSAHAEFIEQCKKYNQLRPTPLILKYEAGGFNTLHQDLYGDVYFPFQVVFLLTEPGVDHEGGEFVLTEQVPRAQSIARVVQANKGDGVIFTTNFRPVKSMKGYYRGKLKHGVSMVLSGRRYAVGVIFHDGK
ncbi:MAG TPA: 2OG-Fe(II) oxygenase [Cyclobacteriaceae bacterium]|nr:2OG-Fe(II) oxygenase [Cyclobacteriaceae bacterium]